MTTSQYFDPDPQVPSARRQIRLVLPDLTLTLVTDRGVFSAGGVDPGTKMLLTDGPPIGAHTTDVLDLGCGYGPIAVTLGTRHRNATVWAIDVNERARALCAHNALANGLTNVRVLAPEEVPADQQFDEIWSNPPIRIGKAELHRLLGMWLARLRPGGVAVLVVQQHLGSDSLIRWLNEQPGRRSERRSSRQGYRIIEVR